MIAIDLEPVIERRLALLAEKAGQSEAFHAGAGIRELLEILESGSSIPERVARPMR
ncbi:hypothetical protein [Haloferula sp. BvORR071]|uniref:hypothetical protein n=1 Tax=Haloferula sp. BvORR071 TaxID=1396141 RepID=UPI002240F671|nr:hypothetical protein [Haloferula sp. BvORR071]